MIAPPVYSRHPPHTRFACARPLRFSKGAYVFPIPLWIPACAGMTVAGIKGMDEQMMRNYGIGKRTVNVEPSPTTLCTSTVPLWISTMFLVIESPNPNPVLSPDDRGDL